MRLVAAPNAVLVNRLSYRDPARWLEDQALLASEGRFDYLLGSIVPDASGWRYWLEAARYIFGSEPVAVELADLHFDRTEKVGRQVWSFRDYANRLDAIEREMKAERTWQARHPWMDLFVPASAIERVVAKTLAELSPKQLQDSHTLTYPLRPETCTTPLTTVPKTEPSFLFGVGPNLGLDDVEGLERLERGYGRVLELATALGSGVYPIGYPLGSVVTSLPVAAPGLLSDAKRRYDPNHRMRVVQ
jgi:FAD/FMN-containing dehydrogenase